MDGAEESCAPSCCVYSSAHDESQSPLRFLLRVSSARVTDHHSLILPTFSAFKCIALSSAVTLNYGLLRHPPVGCPGRTSGRGEDVPVHRRQQSPRFLHAVGITSVVILPMFRLHALPPSKVTRRTDVPYAVWCHPPAAVAFRGRLSEPVPASCLSVEDSLPFPGNVRSCPASTPLILPHIVVAHPKIKL